MNPCDTCDKKFSGRYEFCQGWCSEYQEEPDPGVICREYRPAPPTKYANDVE